MVNIEGTDRRYNQCSILRHRSKNMFDEPYEENKEINAYFKIQRFDGIDNPVRKFGSLKEAEEKSLEWSMKCEYPVEIRIYKVLEERVR